MRKQDRSRRARCCAIHWARTGATLLLIFLYLGVGTGCSRRKAREIDPIEIRVLSSFEKHRWLNEAVERFHKTKARTAAGAPVKVTVQFASSRNFLQTALDTAGSGTVVDAVFPASSFQLNEANQQARLAGQSEPFPAMVSVARTPLVFVTWRQIANRMGWFESGLGWRELAALSADPQLYPTEELGAPFRLTFPHPSSTLLGGVTLLALAARAEGRTVSPKPGELSSPPVSAMIWNFETSLSGHAPSPGRAFENFIEGGPYGISLTITYEHITRIGQGSPFYPDVVVLQPRDGTWVADHPFAPVERAVMDKTRVEAVGVFARFLLSDEEQKALEKAGLRPAKRSPRRQPPWEPPEGLDPAEPTLLDLAPTRALLSAASESWMQTRRPVRTVILLDTSSSMQAGAPSRLDLAKGIVDDLLEEIPPSDQVGFATFSDRLVWRVPMGLRSVNAEPIRGILAGLQPSGSTTVFQSIRDVIRQIGSPSSRRPEHVVVVVLSDGGDMISATTQASLCRELERFRKLGTPLRIMACSLNGPYGYGALRRVAISSGGYCIEVNPENAQAIAAELAAWF
ncbi:MAG: substrate-binding domain-containing protein [Verrucomicrobiia bacterium]